MIQVFKLGQKGVCVLLREQQGVCEPLQHHSSYILYYPLHKDAGSWCLTSQDGFYYSKVFMPIFKVLLIDKCQPQWRLINTRIVTKYGYCEPRVWWWTTQRSDWPVLPVIEHHRASQPATIRLQVRGLGQSGNNIEHASEAISSQLLSLHDPVHYQLQRKDYTCSCGQMQEPMRMTNSKLGIAAFLCA